MNKMKLTAIAVAVISASSFSSSALAEVEANIGVTSDYIWRGVSQSSDAASVSGGLDYADDSGFYAGTWIGSLGDADSGFSGSEVDFYAGYAGEAGDFGYDIGYILYHYPSEDDIDFGEIYIGGSYDAFSFGLAYTIHSDVGDDEFFGEGGLYIYGSYGFDLTDDIGAAITIGHYDFDAEGVEDDSYAHAQIDISKGDFTFSIVKTQDDTGFDNDTKFVVSWGTTF